MSFSETLNSYINAIGCSSKELAEASGVPASTLSRYRAGERKPSAESPQILALANALHYLGANILDQTEEDILRALMEGCTRTNDQVSFRAERLDQLMTVLSISGTDLSRALNYDSSYISRIRTGSRLPANRQETAKAIGEYVQDHLRTPKEKDELSALLQVPLLTPENTAEAVSLWLTQPSNAEDTPEEPSDVRSFLGAMDSFDLNDYLKAVKFDQIKLPTMPFQLPTHKYYYKLEGMRTASLDFEKAVATSSGSKHVVMASTMPMEDMAEDADFPKKWLFGLACMIKRGVTIDMIHDLNRPFKEMLMGLEAYIPLYMTGQVNPWYFPDAEDCVHYHHDWIADEVALTGEAVVGAHENGRYYLTNAKSEMPYFQQRAADLLKRAIPAMRIFTNENKDGFFDFLQKEAQKKGSVRSVLSTPPLYVLNDQELAGFLSLRGIDASQQAVVAATIRSERDLVLGFLKKGTFQLCLPALEQQDDAPLPVLTFPDAFLDLSIPCTKSDLEYLYEKAWQFAQDHPGYSVTAETAQPFQNIHMMFKLGEWALISKAQAPLIHFVIEHPELRDALENYEHPIIDAR